VGKRVAIITRLSNDGKWVRVNFVYDGQRPTVKWIERRKL
jgi:hypothetical protein